MSDRNVLSTAEKSLNDVYKSFIYEKFKPKPKKIIRSLITELVREHNNNPNKKNKLSLKAHSVPYFIYDKVIDFYTEN